MIVKLDTVRVRGVFGRRNYEWWCNVHALQVVYKKVKLCFIFISCMEVKATEIKLVHFVVMHTLKYK